jgi:hypothetical protein
METRKEINKFKDFLNENSEEKFPNFWVYEKVCLDKLSNYYKCY